MTPHTGELGTIWRWYEETTTALRARETLLLASVAAGGAVSTDVSVGATPDEVREVFRRYQLELDHSASLAVMAAGEARLMLDYQARLKHKKKDAVTKACREKEKAVRRRQQQWPKLDEDVLEIWALEKIAARPQIAKYRGVLNLRHWVAHGRYWRPQLGANYSPLDAYNITTMLLRSLAI